MRFSFLYIINEIQKLHQVIICFFLPDFAALNWVVANGPNFIKTFILMYDFLCCFAHCVKKDGILSARFICIASCLKCEIMALFEIDKSQISFSASETALFFRLFCFVFFFFVLFSFFFFISSVFSKAKFVNPW